MLLLFVLNNLVKDVREKSWDWIKEKNGILFF